MPELPETLEESTGLHVSRETMTRLETHHTLLQKWNPTINLVSKATLSADGGWQRHILDSAQVLTAAPRSGGKWLDFGTGGGFPGLVCAILAAELNPDLSFVLVESDKRKSAFLTTVAQTVGIRVSVMSERIERLPPQNAEIVSARAVAALPDLFAYARPHLSRGGSCLFPKGKKHAEEIASARKDWTFKLTQIPSITDPEAAILVVGDIERV